MEPVNNPDSEETLDLDLAFENMQLDGYDPSMTVITLIGIFIGWLHLLCGLSDDKCQAARAFILYIFNMASRHPILDDLDHRQLPKDTRTIIKNLSISPELREQVCCPSCFSLYEPVNAPWTCNYKKSFKARECGETLFRMKSMYRGLRHHGMGQNDRSLTNNLVPNEIGHPRNVYVTQSLISWLRWFVCKKEIEDEIAKWSEKLSQSDDPKIYDIQQSQAWEDLTWPTPIPTDPEPLNLVVSLFVAWFDPRGNKQHGAQQSMGVLSYNCLNLPPSSRNSIHNTCVAGITPGPGAPDTITISHVLRGLVDDLLLLETGIVMITHAYPNGRLIRCKLLALLGDSVAMHKVAGFASHSATLYCAWCWGQSTDVNRLLKGRARTNEEVVSAAKDAEAALTLNQKHEILKKTGVRWSEFTRLTYRQPVTHLPLGMMHNWFEGVVHHHFFYRWGFVLYTKEQKSATKRKRQRDGQGDDEALVLEQPSKQVMYEKGGGNAIEDQGDSDNSDDDDDDSSDIEPELGAGWDGGLFSKEDILFFRERMQDVVLPTGIPCMPANLGEANHGSLKAAQWHSLIAYVIPLIVTEQFATDLKLQKDSTGGQILINSGALCQCTNFVTAERVGEYEAVQFENFYQKYTDSSARIFEKMTINPNHHYALHIGEQLRTWGPLNQVAEHGGEKLIEVLQQIETNNALARMDGTLMIHFSQWQRLHSDHAVIDEILNQEKPEVIGEKVASPYRIQLDSDYYDGLLAYVQSGFGKIIRDYRQLPHPPGALILRPDVVPKATLKISEYVSVSVIKPNNCIRYKSDDGGTCYGLVRQIYQFTDPYGKQQTALLVNPIENLFPKAEVSPTRFFRYILFLHKSVVGKIEQDFIYVFPKRVVSVCAYRLLPEDVFGIDAGGIILRPYDYRGQLDIS